MIPIIKQYIELKSQVYLFCIWPEAKGKESHIHKILLEYGPILYTKKVRLTHGGMRLFLGHAYPDDAWTDDGGNRFSESNFCESEYFPNSKTMRAFWLETSSIENAEVAVNRITALFGIGKKSAHCTFTRKETLSLSKILLNQNTIDFLNLANPFCSPQFMFLVFNFRKAWEELPHSEQEQYCLDSSAVLAAYGIIELKHLDCLAFSDSLQSFGNVFIEKNASNLVHHSVAIDELIHNPCHHFYFLGIKFVTLSNVLKMKIHRGNESDLKEVALSQLFLQDGSRAYLLCEVFKYFSEIFYLIRVTIWTISMKIRSNFIHLYKWLKKWKSSIS
jgi:hypothetical protein